MSHANAQLTPPARLRLARLVVDEGWTYSAAAKMFMVAPRTARKWADRYRFEGVTGMSDRSSRPRRCPRRTSSELVRQIMRLRWRRRSARCNSPATRDSGLYRARGVGALPDQPTLRHRSGQRGTAASLRALPPGLVDSCRCHEVRQHPRVGWRYVGRQEGKRHRTLTAHRTGDRDRYSGPRRHRLPAYRHRRSLPGGLRRNLPRREGSHSDRSVLTSRDVVRRPRSHRRAGAVRQRLGIPVRRLA